MDARTLDPAAADDRRAGTGRVQYRRCRRTTRRHRAAGRDAGPEAARDTRAPRYPGHGVPRLLPGHDAVPLRPVAGARDLPVRWRARADRYPGRAESRTCGHAGPGAQNRRHADRRAADGVCDVPAVSAPRFTAVGDQLVGRCDRYRRRDVARRHRRADPVRCSRVPRQVLRTAAGTDAALLARSRVVAHGWKTLVAGHTPDPLHAARRPAGCV